MKTKSIKMNMIMNAVLTMSSLFFPLITFPYVSRILLPIGTGKVNFAASVISYFAMFAQLGIPTYGIRVCAKVRDDKEKLSKTVHELFIINLFMSALVYFVFTIALLTVSRFKSEKLLLIIMSVSILLNALGVEWLYKALEQYSYITIRSIVFKLVAIIAMFLFVHKQGDYVIYGGISIFAASASNILNFLNLRKYIYMKPMGSYNIKKHIKMILVFFSMSVATTIYTNLDNVMLGFMKGDEAVGYYSAAVKIKGILLSIVTSASTVLLPRASYYVDKGQMDEFYRILKKTMNFILLMAIPFTVYFMMYAREGILLLSGKEYEGAIIPMQVIMPTLILVGITNVTGIQMMVPLGRENHVLYSEIAGAVVDLILNMILISKFGPTGAAIGTLTAEIVVLAWQFMEIRDINVKLFEQVMIWKIALAIVIGTVASIWVKWLEFSLFISLLISSACFFGLYGIVLLITREKFVCEIVGAVKERLLHI